MTTAERIRLHLRECGLWLAGWIPAAAGTLLRRLAYRPFFRKAGRFRSGVGVVIYGFSNISLGTNVALNRLSMLAADRGRITIGDNVFLGDFSIISGDDGEVVIGDNVLIASGVVIQAADHRIERTDIPIMEQGHTPGRIVIEGRRMDCVECGDHLQCDHWPGRGGGRGRGGDQGCAAHGDCGRGSGAGHTDAGAQSGFPGVRGRPCGVSGDFVRRFLARVFQA